MILLLRDWKRKSHLKCQISLRLRLRNPANLPWRLKSQRPLLRRTIRVTWGEEGLWSTFGLIYRMVLLKRMDAEMRAFYSLSMTSTERRAILPRKVIMFLFVSRRGQTMTNARSLPRRMSGRTNCDNGQLSGERKKFYWLEHFLVRAHNLNLICHVFMQGGGPEVWIDAFSSCALTFVMRTINTIQWFVWMLRWGLDVCVLK